MVLERVYKTSVQLQKEGLPINVAVNLLQSLLEFIESLRGRFDEFEQSAIEMCGIPSYRDEEKRKRSRKRLFDEMDTSDSDMEDTISSPREDFKINTFLPIIDKLNTELRTRMEAYISLSNRFGFLSHLSDLSPDELRAAASNLVRHYPSDLEKELESEIIHFSSLIKGLIDANVFKATNSYETDLFVQLNENALNDAFPNVNILLKIYLCMFANNCKGERSFSKLKLILNFCGTQWCKRASHP